MRYRFRSVRQPNSGFARCLFDGPEILEARRRQFSIAHRVLDVAVNPGKPCTALASWPLLAIQQLAAVSQRGDTKLLQVLNRQVRKDRLVNVVQRAASVC